MMIEKTNLFILSAGHDLFFLDYRKCGLEGEPSVVLIDQGDDYAKIPVAENFEEFIDMLYEPA